MCLCGRWVHFLHIKSFGLLTRAQLDGNSALEISPYYAVSIIQIRDRIWNNVFNAIRQNKKNKNKHTQQRMCVFVFSPHTRDSWIKCGWQIHVVRWNIFGWGGPQCAIAERMHENRMQPSAREWWLVCDWPKNPRRRRVLFAFGFGIYINFGCVFFIYRVWWVCIRSTIMASARA